MVIVGRSFESMSTPSPVVESYPRAPNSPAGNPSLWNQHPVISAVLWMLGSENRPNLTQLERKSQESLDKENLRASGSRPWGRMDSLDSLYVHDSTAQSTASVIENSKSTSTDHQIDSTDDIGQDRYERGERTTSGDGTQLNPTSIRGRQQQPFHHPFHGNQATAATMLGAGRHGFPPGATVVTQAQGEDTPDRPDTNASPQWGFYVAITPPQAEMYSAIKKDLMTIQQQSGQAQLQGKASPASK